MQPFQSLQPEIIAARAGQLFNKPDTVQIDVIGTTLVVNGTAPAAWKEQLLDSFRALAGVDAIDLSGFTDAPDPAAITAPEPDQRQIMRDRLETLDDRRFLFDEAVRFSASSMSALEQHAIALRQLQADADQVDLSLVVTLAGATDGVGDIAANARLAQRRAAAALEVLTAAGVRAGVAERPAGLGSDNGPLQDPSQRYVRIDLQLQEPPATR
jgi:outer membrane protein OmpA-like peptidoglycan-associated protein